MSAYTFTEIEKKWREIWDKNQVYKVSENVSKPKYYVLDMFPYPSGAGLHVGHPLGYIASDVVARYKRLIGYNVLHPIGFDAFGLPAEQYAIETGQHPELTTNKNIERYKAQLKNIGFSYDWDREVKTSDPSYYKWTQWIFLQLYNSWFNPKLNRAESIEKLITLYESGRENQFSKPWGKLTLNEQHIELTQHRLAYKDESLINWCETLGTVLANDEVVNGVSERGGYPVERRRMSQWFLRITKYADRLLEGLETVDFPDSLKEMQRNWIGRSEGAEIVFALSPDPSPLGEAGVRVFTTRPDTIFGVSFMVLAPEHPLVQQITTEEQRSTVENYLKYCQTRSELERKSETKDVSGAFTGAYVQHPFTNENIPVYIAEYVLMGYGTGAIMAVPCGDSRDHAFALKFGIPIPNIFEGIDVLEKAFEEKSGILANSECEWFSLNGLNFSDAKEIVLQSLIERGIGTKQINYRMRDAGFSRQRYWGEPFPITYKDGLAISNAHADLPVTLPEVTSYKPTGDGKSPLSSIDEWVNLSDGSIRETDTMPGYAGSSWYYLRYMDPNNDDAFCDPHKSEYWQQVDLYIGGAEHAVGHLLYSRMWCKVLHDLGFIKFDEPFKKLLNQGMIGGVVYHFYYDQITRRIFSDSILTNRKNLISFKVPNEYVSEDETFSKEGMQAFCAEFTQFDGFEFIMDKDKFTFEKSVTKMSKRLRNVVNPDEVIDKYGADTFRMYEMFLGPIDQDKPWNTKGIDGVSRFVKRFWAHCIAENGDLLLNNEPANDHALKIINRTLKKVAEDIDKYAFNTCISSFMICLNELQSQKCYNREVFEKFLIMLCPFAPHIAEELWQRLGHASTIIDANYPEINEQYLTDDSFNYPISINGKTRLLMSFSLEEEAHEIENAVMNNTTVQKWLDGKPVKKFILVKGRIVNVVV